MKKLLPLVMLALVMLGACKKDSTDSSSSSGDTSWTLAGVTYKGTIGYRTTTSGGTITSLFNFFDATPSATVKVNSVSFSFFQAPTASGTFQLVGVGQAKTASQVEVSAGTVAPLAYAYIGTSTDISITVNSGKVKIVLPEVNMKCTTTNPDVKLSGTFVEQ